VTLEIYRTLLLRHSISAPAALPAGLDPSAPTPWISQQRRLSHRSDAGDLSDRFGIGIGLSLGFPQTLPSRSSLAKFRTVSRLEIGKQWVLRIRPLNRPVSADTLLELFRWWSPLPCDPWPFTRNHNHNSEFTIALMWPESTREFPHTAPSVGSLL
jgi:hypothetical protein